MRDHGIPQSPIAGALVYVRGLRGPEPEKWPIDAPGGVKVGKEILVAHELPADLYTLTIAELEKHFPLKTEGQS